MSFVKREPTKENWIRVGIVEKTYEILTIFE
jgi:hypothetical protein